MKESLFTIQENKMIAENIFRCIFIGDTSNMKKPGQFVNIRISGFYLRRPISVCDVHEDRFVIIYRTVGLGTKALSACAPGTSLNILTGLGNGYDTSLSGEKPLLIGGGIGVPPLYLLAKELIRENRNVNVIMGFNTKNEVFYEENFKALGCGVTVTTADGSYGLKGFVTDAMRGLAHTHFYACGPEPMLKAVCRESDAGGSLSFEARMGCGFGACMGCSCKTLTGNKRICREGPVMQKEEIIWED